MPTVKLPPSYLLCPLPGLPFIVISSLIVATVIVSFFTDSSIGNAPLFNKLFGGALVIFGCVFAAKSEKWLGFIENDRVLAWAQVVGTFLLIALGFTVMMAWHSGALGTTTNPF